MRDGERQVAPDTQGIRRDHLARYEWAATRLGKPGRVVDLACGVGYGTQILAKAGHRAVGYDIDVEAIAYARQHYAHERAEFRQVDAATAPSLGRVDAAVCFETIEHVADPRPLLQSLHRSAPVLLASVPNEDVFPYRGYKFHFRHYTPAEFKRLLAETGWEVTEWWGQTGPESEVERDEMGRTIIAVAKRARRAKKVAAAVPPAQKHVAILGLGPSVAQYMSLARGLGGRSAVADEVWCVNALGDVFNCDRIFHMDDVRIQEIRAASRPDSNIAAMLRWLSKHPGPIYTSRPHPDYPGMVAFPFEDVINDLKFPYFNSTVAYAIAFAIHLGVTKISCFGVDFTYPDRHTAEKGRACCEFWLGVAAARGITLRLPQTTSLMDACVPLSERIYGYDTIRPNITRDADGRATVTFTDVEKLPTAEEIEARYDHDQQHPNPLLGA